MNLLEKSLSTLLLTFAIFELASCNLIKGVIDPEKSFYRNYNLNQLEVEIKLQDVTLQDTRSLVLSSQTYLLSRTDTFPFAFELSYNPKQIKADHRYSLSASIRDAKSKRLLFLTTTHHGLQAKKRVNDGKPRSTKTAHLKLEFVGPEDAQIKQDTMHMCSLKADSGLCRAYFERFSYNSSTGKCERFIYGGCGGNENRFGSEEECIKACVK